MTKKRIFTDDEINLMINMYNDGETYVTIGKALHTKGTRVSSILKSMGYEKRPHNVLKNHEYLSASRKNSVDETFFEEINSESKAYWLGFLYADGYVCKKKTKTGIEKGGATELSLQSEDEYHIRNFLHDIRSTAPVADKKAVLDGKEYLAKRTIISSIKIVNDLIRHGCFENKSLILEPPTTIPDDLIPHFIRGYFDGDGCVAFYTQSYSYRYSVLGTENFLKFIAEKSGIRSYDIRSFEHKKCYELLIYAKDNIEIFHNYIYRDKTIYLERKYLKSLAMMKWCQLNDSRNETQKMADLLDSKLIPDDSLMDQFENFFMSFRSETAAMADLLD